MLNLFGGKVVDKNTKLSTLKSNKDENIVLQLQINYALRFNILNNKVVWIPTTKTSTIGDLKKHL